MSKLTWTVPVIFLSGCAAFQNPDPANVATYCTAETGYRMGYLSRAYYGTCPKQTEGAFLAGLQRGRGYRANPPQALPYYERMEQTEKLLLAAATDPEREQLRTQLREIEWWTIHIVNCSCSYVSSGRE